MKKFILSFVAAAYMITGSPASAETQKDVQSIYFSIINVYIDKNGEFERKTYKFDLTEDILAEMLRGNILVCGHKALSPEMEWGVLTILDEKDNSVSLSLLWKSFAQQSAAKFKSFADINIFKSELVTEDTLKLLFVSSNADNHGEPTTISLDSNEDVECTFDHLDVEEFPQSSKKVKQDREPLF